MFYTNLSLGYMGYLDKTVVVNTYKTFGNTLGLAFDLGYDIPLYTNISFGLKLSYIAGVLTKLDVDNGKTVETIELEEDEYENLKRIDFSIGIRFNF